MTTIIFHFGILQRDDKVIPAPDTNFWLPTSSLHRTLEASEGETTLLLRRKLSYFSIAPTYDPWRTRVRSRPFSLGVHTTGS